MSVAVERIANIPNALTLARLILSIGVFALIGLGRYLPALALFGVAALTDAVDGWVARAFGQSTAFGRQFDPLVDKVAVAGTYITLLGVPGPTGLAPWMVTTIVARELLIQGLRSHLEAGGRAFGAKFAGKLKTTAQMGSIVAILACLRWSPGPWATMLRDGLTWSAVALTIYSGLGYLAMAFPPRPTPASADRQP